MGSNPSQFKGATSPVESVRWDECQKFLEKLSTRSRPRGGKFQLPTEAQWEYACRAGSTTRYCFGDEESGLAEYAWYDANSDKKSYPVGQKKPNAWGLYDMQGNVWEWCSDWYAGYANSAADDPAGPASGADGVRRGGSWGYDARRCRSACRGKISPRDSRRDLGLRVSRAAGE